MEKIFYMEESSFKEYKENLYTDSIYINTLIKLAYDVIEHKKNAMELKELCKILEGLYGKLTILYKNLFFEISEEPVKEHLEEFYRVIQEISQCNEHRNDAVLKEHIDNIINITEILFESFKKLKERETKFPLYSKSPLLNELIISAREIIKEHSIEDELKINSLKKISLEKGLKEKIHFLIEFTEATEKQIYSLDCDTVTLMKEYPLVRKNLSLFKEGLQETGLYFQNRHKNHIEKGLNMTTKAVDELFSSLDILYEASDIITKIICLKCSHKNSLHGDYCALCHTLLPKTVTSKESELYEIKDFEYIITDNFNNLLEGARKIEDGEITDREFTDIMDSMKEKLEKARFNFNLIQNKAIIISEIFLYVQEQLKNIENGMKQMGLYVKSKKSEYLDKGLTVIFESSKILNEIQLLALEAEREIARRKGKISHS